MTFRWLLPGLRPPVPMDGRQEHIFLLVGAAALFAGYDQNVFGLAIPQIQASLHIPENQVGLTVAYFRVAAIASLPLVFAAGVAGAQGHITSPKEFFGHNIGDDYFLPNYDQFMAYWKKIDAESDRMQVVEIGKTSEGRPHLAAALIAGQQNILVVAQTGQAFVVGEPVGKLARLKSQHFLDIRAGGRI